MCINRYKTIARFGLMHMVATNICVWFNTIVEETLHQIGNVESSSHHQLAAVLYSQEYTTQTPNRTLLADVNRRHSVNVSARGRDNGPTNVHGTIAHLTTTAAQLMGSHGHLNPQNVTHGQFLHLVSNTLTPPRLFHHVFMSLNALTKFKCP